MKLKGRRQSKNVQDYRKGGNYFKNLANSLGRSLYYDIMEPEMGPSPSVSQSMEKAHKKIQVTPGSWNSKNNLKK